MGFLKKPSVIISIVVVVIVVGIGLYAFSGSDGVGSVDTEMATTTDITQLVSVSGNVRPAEEVTLSFETGGTITDVGASVDQSVTEGAVLARLSSNNLFSDLEAARARVDSQQARLNQLLAGASQEEIAIARQAVQAAKDNLEETRESQTQSVDNAYRTLLASDLEAVPASSGTGNPPPVITGTYRGEEEGEYYIDVYQSGADSGASFRISGLENRQGNSVNTETSVPLGTRGLYIQFPEDYSRSADWIVAIPNERSAGYTANLNAYESAKQNKTQALQAAKNQLEARERELDRVKSQTRSEEIDAQRAAVRQAEAQVSSVSARLSDTAIRAPFDGVVTEQNAQVGEIARAQEPLVTLISGAQFEIEVDVPEADVSKITTNDQATITLDALEDQTFTARVVSIDPQATIVEGVPTYKVTLQFNDDTRGIRAGMTADVEILTAQKDNVRAISSRAVIRDGDKKYVRVLVSREPIEFERREVTTGLRGSSGMIEIISGIEKGEEVITFLPESFDQ